MHGVEKMPVYKLGSHGKKRIFASFKQMDEVNQWVGLMFSRKVTKPLLFSGNGKISIHSFFCPVFEAVFLDKSGKIVKAVKVKPWTPLVAAKAFFLFEMPPGTVSKYLLKRGDALQWTN